MILYEIGLYDIRTGLSPLAFYVRASFEAEAAIRAKEINPLARVRGAIYIERTQRFCMECQTDSCKCPDGCHGEGRGFEDRFRSDEGHSTGTIRCEKCGK